MCNPKIFNPKTLYQIYKELINLRLFTGLTCFRVRETFTLMDYLICHSDRWKWDYQNMPAQMWGVLLESPYNCYYPLDCNEDNYALLSSSDELEYLRRMGVNAAPDIVKNSYKACDKNWRMTVPVV